MTDTKMTDTKNLFNLICWDLFLRYFLLENSGKTIDVYEDGTLVLMNQNESTMGPETPVASLKCIGVGNLDCSVFTDGFCHWDDGIGKYVVSEGVFQPDAGRVIGDIDDVICECIDDGDMSCFIEDCKREIEYQIKAELLDF